MQAGFAKMQTLIWELAPEKIWDWESTKVGTRQLEAFRIAFSYICRQKPSNRDFQVRYFYSFFGNFTKCHIISKEQTRCRQATEIATYTLKWFHSLLLCK